MPRRVAVEKNLSAIGDHLAQNGIEVERVDRGDLTPSRLQGYGAVVVSGQATNFLGMEDIKADIPVIEAAGRTADEITAMVKERLQLQG
ncbi:YkuS family protein [Moorella sulfitireducens (nom. illeg.)]|uniref:YkuS family protein n=1 Tax=Neomoorella sulfitireducens TaxID=2972948 RepID=UPI0021AD4172|nr:YkuS family protein [Moorella sulfitireducens]